MTQTYLRIIIHGEKGSGKDFLLDTFLPLFKSKPKYIYSFSAPLILETIHKINRIDPQSQEPIIIQECTDEEIFTIIEKSQHIISPLIFITQETPRETMKEFKGEKYRYISSCYKPN